MNENTTLADIVRVVVFNLEVVYCNGRFKYLMLYSFKNNIFSVDEDKNIPGTKINRICPTLDGTEELMEIMAL